MQDTDSRDLPTDPTGLRVTVVGLHFAPEPSGNAPYTTGLVRGLSKRGHRVHAIVGYPHYPQWRVLDGYTGWSMDETLDGASIRRLRHYVPADPSLLRRLVMEASFGLRAAFADWKRPDAVVLVSPGLLATAIASVRAKVTRTPYVVWVQDIYTLGLSESGRGGRLLASTAGTLERSVLQSGGGVIAIHERFKRYLRDSLGVRRAPISVVRNWSHVEIPSVDRAAVRRRQGWAEDDVVVLHAGNMGVKQALDNVVLASRVASERGSRVRFVLLGDGNQRAALQAMGSNDRLEFLSTLPDGAFEEVLASADILLVNEQPGAAEAAVPSKLTTYFSTGLPVVAATDAQSITAEELQLSGGGVRVDPADPAALVDAAEALGSDPELGRRLGQAGKRFRTEFQSEDNSLDAMASILRGLAGKSAAAPAELPTSAR
ncbi:glycosyltransferase family 4 protein [Amnibacterium flavum]|uniref:Glycosyltransferase WbuB n=1 Tax=Amnibacterium flavum TaxID=2173173 RepID=A0A2V1HTJ7_9MICO|nr:glycosyltransferase family 4 protein [Amnibacterium flavum]PVZ95888.1 glycosyltransferase WbuB [Amnibacterium flavum]